MSDKLNQNQMNRMHFSLSVAGIILAILMFGFIILIAYLPTRPKPVDQDLIDQRLAILAEVNSKQHSLANSYGWVDQTKGVVRIPIERAMELTERDLRGEALRE
tara:strand:+ start:4915 stop:5226 length:312 start_codon:yes stop_codon:yes gene_type:complete